MTASAPLARPTSTAMNGDHGQIDEQRNDERPEQEGVVRGVGFAGGPTDGKQRIGGDEAIGEQVVEWGWRAQDVLG